MSSAIDPDDLQPEDEQNILGRMRDFTEIYESTWGSTYSLIKKAVGDDETAKDLTHDIYLKAWKLLSTLRNPKAILRTMARNRIVDYFRAKKGVQHNSLDAMIDDGEDFVGTGMMFVDPAEQAEINEENLLMREALRRMKPKYQKVFVLKMRGEKDEVVAKKVGVNFNSVPKLFERAKKQYLYLHRQLLQEGDVTDDGGLGNE